MIRRNFVQSIERRKRTTYFEELTDIFTLAVIMTTMTALLKTMVEMLRPQQ